MRFFITGGAGFIGCNAASGLRAAGHEVVAVDNFTRAGGDANARWLAESCGVEVAKVDVRNADDILHAVRNARPDAVLHCAAQVAVTRSVEDPRRDFEDNALGSFNVLEAIRLGAPRAAVLYTSTNKVYGGMEDAEVRRDGDRWGYASLPHGVSEDRPLDFHSPYGCSKGAADQYFRDYSRIFGLRTVVFRQSCIYGTRQFGIEDQGWVAWFTIRAAQGRPVTIFGDGMQVRDVLFVTDLVDAFTHAIERIDQVSGRIYNIGGGPQNTLSLVELVRTLESLTGRRLEVTHGDWRPGDQRVFVCDVRKAESELAWKPRVTAQQGVEKLYAWVHSNLALFA